MTSTVAPAAPSLALASSAASLGAFSRTGLGAPSTRSLASFRPRPEPISRTTLMTPIFLSPAASRMTSNSDCSSAASAGAPPAAGPAAATATGAAAVTSKVSSNFFTNSESSSKVSSLKASSNSSVDSLDMVLVLPRWLRGYSVVSAGDSAGASVGSASAAGASAAGAAASGAAASGAAASGAAASAGSLGGHLLLQRGGKPGHLRGGRVEQRGRLGQVGFHP